MNTKQKTMRTVWQSLLWKEWHEHKWKLAGFLLLAVLLMLMFSWMPHRGGIAAMPMMVGLVLFFHSILAGLFQGMHTAGGGEWARDDAVLADVARADAKASGGQTVGILDYRSGSNAGSCCSGLRLFELAQFYACHAGWCVDLD